jgi:O-antigen/teichoic acid export membrane protein
MTGRRCGDRMNPMARSSPSDDLFNHDEAVSDGPPDAETAVGPSLRGAAKRAVRAVSSRRGASVLDQALASSSNLLLALLVGRHSTVQEFGVFALSTGMYWFCLGANRALIGEPGLVARDSDPRRSASARLYVGAGFAVISSAGFWGLAVVFGDPLLILMGVALVPLLLQDGLRYLFFARAEPRGALALDAVWLITQFCAIPVVLAWLDPEGPLVWVGAWTIGALTSVVVGVLWLRPGWSLSGVRAWMTTTRRLATGFLSDFLITTGAQQATLLLLPAVSSLGVVAALRTAQVVNGPLNMLMGATAIILLPAVAGRREAKDLTGALRDARRTAAHLVAISTAYLVVLSVALPHWGGSLLGDQWQNSRAVIPIICVHMALMGVLQGPVLTLRGFGLVRSLVLTRLVITPGNLAGPLLGAYFGGAIGMACGMVMSASAAALAWWLTLGRFARAPRASQQRASWTWPAGVGDDPVMVTVDSRSTRYRSSPE